MSVRLQSSRRSCLLFARKTNSESAPGSDGTNRGVCFAFDMGHSIGPPGIARSDTGLGESGDFEKGPAMADTSESDSTPATLAEAARLFNEREYFDCHDVLEELWGDTLGEDRDFYQGLLHAAVSLFHLSEGNPAGARKMYASSLRYLAAYGSSFGGLNLDRLRADLMACFEPLRGGVPAGFAAPHLETLPTLYWSSEHE